LRKLLLALIALLLFNCAGSKPEADWTAIEYYRIAKEKYDDEDYFEAVSDFTVVLLRFAGSTVADSAQYYLADCHYQMGDYLIAAVEFERLVNTMSQSGLVPKAQLRMAESYYQLSPRFTLDQKFTDRAIREYQNFIEDFPTDSLKEEAEKKILFLRNKLSHKEYQNAEIYRKMSEYEAAIIYYDQVLAKYYDTDWADDAQFGKIRTYLDSEQMEAAVNEIEKFEAQFPASDLLKELPDIKKDIAEMERELAKE
jgi:outer membrane protein assembly factor BamD